MSTRRAIAVLAVVMCVLAWSTPVAAEDTRVERLVKQLGSEKFEERETAVKELIARGPSVLDALEAASNSKDLEISRRAKECISRIHSNRQAVVWIKQLRSLDEEERISAINHLAQIGPELAPFVSTLTDLLKDPNADVRMATVSVLATVGPASEKALPDLLRILQDKGQTAFIRSQATIAMRNMGAPGLRAAPILFQILETEGPEMQRVAMTSLMELLDHQDPRLAPALWKAYSTSKDWNVKFGAIVTLAQMRNAPEKTIPAILEMLQTRTFKTAGDKQRERCLMSCLGLYGPIAESAIPYLVHVVKDEHRRLVDLEEALRALMRIGEPARKLLPELKDLDEARLADTENIMRAVNSIRQRK
jgi:HEAT repeat protein